VFDDYSLVMLAPLFAAAANSCVHLFACRWFTRRGGYFRLLAGFIAGLPVVLVVSRVALLSWDATSMDRAVLLAFNVLTYIGLAFGYFAFVNLNVCSLRIRMLQELLEAGGILPRRELLACYNTDEVSSLRIDRLLHGRYLIEVQGRVYSGNRCFLLIARVFDILRWIVLGSKAPSAAHSAAVARKNVPLENP